MLFVESMVSDAGIIRSNMLAHIDHDPEFAGMGEAEALADLEAKIDKYRAIYEPLDEVRG